MTDTTWTFVCDGKYPLGKAMAHGEPVEVTFTMHEPPYAEGAFYCPACGGRTTPSIVTRAA